MPFVEQEESFEDQVIDGKKVKVYKAKSRSNYKTLKNR